MSETTSSSREGAANGRPARANGDTNTLGRFLKSRREALKPPRGPSVETLVHEIFLAGFGKLSSGHYYRIEEGIRKPSGETLEIIAKALHLSPADREYAHSLIDEKAPPRPVVRQHVSESIVRVMQYQEPAAAYVIDRKLDILKWNDATCEIYGFDLERVLDPRDRNVAWLVFNGPGLQSRLRHWETHAQRIVAQCRTRWAGLEKDCEIQEIISRLHESELFAKWWDRPEVMEVALPGPVRKEIDHPDVGLLVLEQTVFPTGDNPDLHFVLTIPLPEENTEGKLKRLAALRMRRSASTSTGGEPDAIRAAAALNLAAASILTDLR